MATQTIAETKCNDVTFDEAVAFICKHKAGAGDDDEFKKGVGKWSSQLGMLGYMQRGKNGNFKSTWKATLLAKQRYNMNREKSPLFTFFGDFFFRNILKV